ncbi:MAG: hypothetical protein GC181_10430 [Bacteroidetes bacterium]|nr:hypothetical protein [Bacteroidota bacterium]
MNIKDAHITVMVTDLDRSVSFYESIGFSTKQRWGNHYAELTAPGLSIGLHPTESVNPNERNISIGLTTDNFENVAKDLDTLNVQYNLRNEEGGNFIEFSDPDGNPIYFIKPKW